MKAKVNKKCECDSREDFAPMIKVRSIFLKSIFGLEFAGQLTNYTEGGVLNSIFNLYTLLTDFNA